MTSFVSSTDYTTTRILDPKWSTILKPSIAAKALIAEDYRAKYSVDIYVLADPNGLEDAIAKLGENDGSKIGLVVPVEAHFGHVTPVVLSREGGKIRAVTYDSAAVGDVPARLEDLPAIRLRRQLASLCDELYVADNHRQFDSHSCHTDAMVVLKDVLRRGDPVAALGPKTPRPLGIGQVFTAAVPAYLHKLDQSPSEFQRAQPAPEALVHPRKSKTLAAHRLQYTVSLTREKVRSYRDTVAEREQADPSNPYPIVWRHETDSQQKSMNLFLKQKGHAYAERAAAIHAELLGSQGREGLEAVYRDRIIGWTRELTNPEEDHG